jgi:exopolyphosphatase/pppGpp-phosphohydrolase
MIPKLQDMSNKQRAELPGVSQSRARQIVAGAIVARTVMEKLHINELEICPGRCAKELCFVGLIGWSVRSFQSP